jgi:DNA-binding CsgD family transcriptional regulator
MDQKIYRILTRREFDVLECMSKGKSARETAEILYIGYETVRTHKKHIMAKLNIHSNEAFMKFIFEKKSYFLTISPNLVRKFTQNGEKNHPIWGLTRRGR